jgi:TonB family protein
VRRFPFIPDRRISSTSALWFAVLAAILLHLLSFKALPGFNIGKDHSAPGDADNPIVISPLPKNTKLPVVRTSRAENEEAPETPPRFAGEFRNRVKKETQSRRKGRFREGPGHQSGVGPGNGPPSTGLSQLLPFGANPYELPKDVAEGNQTVLNTEPVMYASFLNRIADEVYDPWVRHVQEALEERMRSGKRLEDDSYLTRLEVVMDERGKVTAIKVLHSCGIVAFDEAAKRAFWETEPFPHPPREMLDSRSEVHLTYELQIEWQTSLFHILPKLL